MARSKMRSKKPISRALGMAMVIAVLSCGNDDVPANGGSSSGTGGAGCIGADGLGCLQTAGGTPARFDCAPTEPTSGDPISLTLWIRNDDLDNFNSPGVDVSAEISPGSEIVEPCAGPCTTSVGDASGNATVMLSAPSWFAYRIPSTGAADDDAVLSVGYRIVRPSDTTKRIAFLTNGWIAQTSAAVGRMRAPGSALVFGTIFDCDDQQVAGASVRIYVDDAEVATGGDATDPLVFYYAGGAPALEAATTDGSGWYSVANVPTSGTGTLRVEVYGTLVSGGERVLIACEQARIFPDGYTTRPLRPLRTDYPAGNGCAGK